MKSDDIVIEPMDAFFTQRVEGYDEHMLKNVPGCAEGYRKLTALLGDETRDLLDLGCGTGLELALIFERFPALRVTGIDMTPAMLERLREKYPDRAITLIEGSYIGYDFGENRYDAAVSFETMHHMDYRDKLSVYSSVCRSLRHGGEYIECDYMVESEDVEKELFNENARLRREQRVPEGVFCHFDTPFCIKNQLRVLREAGFSDVEMMWREENTTIIRAGKK